MMKPIGTALAILALATVLHSTHAQDNQTSMQQAAQKLSQDLADALPRSTAEQSVKRTLTADAEALVKAADARAQGNRPDRSATRAAARELKDAFSSSFAAEDAKRLTDDLQNFKSSVR